MNCHVLAAAHDSRVCNTDSKTYNDGRRQVITEQVRFVHCTPDAERLITKMARVSNPSNDENWDTGPRLLRYLIKHKHWSPFEMASLCVLIETERDIAAQILRHRSFSSRSSPPAMRAQRSRNALLNACRIRPTAKAATTASPKMTNVAGMSAALG